jgi:two-component sensor histidine kinase
VFTRRAKQAGGILGLYTVLGFCYGWEIHFFNLVNHQNIPLLTGLLRPLPDYWIYAALTPGVIWLNSRFRFRRASLASTVAIHAGAAFTFLIAWSAAKVTFYPVEDLMTGDAAPRSWYLFRILVIDNAHDSLCYFMMIVALNELRHYYRKFKEREVRAAKLEAQLAEAHLKVLKMQLDPHFLFNTLHAVSSLMHEDVAAAEKTVGQLRELLHLSLESGSEQEVTLRREMEFLAGYLNIQKTRFRDRLNVQIQVDPRTLDAMVPNMVLQPLVENAVKHGIASRTTPGLIEIRAECRDQFLFLEVTDDGPDAKGAGPDWPSRGVGISNTLARLQQLYGEAQQFSLQRPEGGGTSVRLEIPFRRQNGEGGK